MGDDSFDLTWVSFGPWTSSHGIGSAMTVSSSSHTHSIDAHVDYIGPSRTEMVQKNKKLSDILMKVHQAIKEGRLDEIREELDEITAEISEEMWEEMFG